MPMRSSAIAALAVLLIVLSAVSAAQRNPWKSENVSIGDIKIHYLEAGSGRHLVFVPGWTMTAEIWREQIPYFAARGFHVVALDPRSHGGTTKSDGGNTYLQHAADLHAFLKALKLNDISVVAWSAGVVTLLDYVASPEAVILDKLVLVDGMPAGFKDADYPGGATHQQMRAIVQGMQEDRKAYADKFARGMFKSRQPELLYKEIVAGSLKTPTGAALALLMDLFTGDRRTALLRIRTPTLIVVPQDNGRLGEYLQSKIAHSKLEIVPDAGHALFLEKPQTFNQVVEAFLKAP